MKIIGMQGDHYIAIVNHTELEKLTGKYYGHLDKLKLGDELDLGAGYNIKSDILGACKATVDAMKAYEKAQDSLVKFAVNFAKSATESD